MAVSTQAPVEDTSEPVTVTPTMVPTRQTVERVETMSTMERVETTTVLAETSRALTQPPGVSTGVVTTRAETTQLVQNTARSETPGTYTYPCQTQYYLL